MVQTEQVTDVGRSCVVEQTREITASGRGGNPLCSGAIWQITVIVYGGGFKDMVSSLRW